MARYAPRPAREDRIEGYAGLLLIGCGSASASRDHSLDAASAVSSLRAIEGKS